MTSVQFDQDGRCPRQPDDAPRSSDDTDDKDASKAPSGRLLVTLAVTSPQVEKIVWTAEFGHIYLTDENAKADESGTRISTSVEVFETGERRSDAGSHC